MQEWQFRLLIISWNVILCLENEFVSSKCIGRIESSEAYLSCVSLVPTTKATEFAPEMENRGQLFPKSYMQGTPFQQGNKEKGNSGVEFV